MKLVVSVNVYFGVFGIVIVFGLGVWIVIMGWVVDVLFVVGLVLYEFGWDWDDWNKLG